MFIVVELQTDAQGIVGNIVSAYATQAEAESKYHDVLAYAAISAIPVHSCVLLSNEGFAIAHECYKHQA